MRHHLAISPPRRTRALAPSWALGPKGKASGGPPGLGPWLLEGRLRNAETQREGSVVSQLVNDGYT
eukprot:1240574-Pyramimonas_sp.AAC.1